MENTPSTTFTVRVDKTTKQRMEKLAKSTGRTRSYLAAEAITEYLAINEWQVGGIKRAITSLESGKSVPHAQVKEWVASWDSKTERPSPKHSKA